MFFIFKKKNSFFFGEQGKDLNYFLVEAKVTKGFGIITLINILKYFFHHN